MKQKDAEKEQQAMMKKGTPSMQEIHIHLEGLNRVTSAALMTPYTAAAKERGITNYKRWFKSHRIAISQERSGEWKLENG